MKNNLVKKRIVIAFSVILVAVLTIICALIKVESNNSYAIELTQLSPNTSRQMMGYFIKTKNGKIIVIDGGTQDDASNLENYINVNGGKVDYWFITHYHIDHTGALSEIINNTDIKIDNIICNFCSRDLVENYENTRLEDYDIITSSLENDKVKDIVKKPSEGEIFNIDNIKIKVIDTYEDYENFNNIIASNLGNNTSTVYKLYTKRNTILFLGDTGTELSNKLLENNFEDLKSDYVQMAHHGQNGATFELYKAIMPTYTLWPTPDWLWDNDNGNGYNSGEWKTLETREWMQELNVKEYYVAKDGDITLKIK